MTITELDRTTPNLSTPPLHWGDLLTINFLFIGTTFLSGALPTYLFASPLLVNLGIARGGDILLLLLIIPGYLVSVLTQPVAGAFSDRLALKWGRRRPVMVIGAVTSLVFLALMAWSLTKPLTNAGVRLPFFPFSDNADYWLILLWFVGLQIGVNTAQAAAQGLIPDMAPTSQRGAAAGMKALFEILVGFVLIAMLVPTIFSNSGNQFVLFGQNLILTIGVVMIVTLFINVTAIRETPLSPRNIPSIRDAIHHSFEIDGEHDAGFINLLAVRLFGLAGLALFLFWTGFYLRDLILAKLPNPGDIEMASMITQSLGFIIFISAVIISIPAGVLSDRFGRRPVTMAGGLVAGLGIFGLLFVQNITILSLGNIAVTDLGAIGIVIGIGMGLFYSATWAWATDLVPSDHAARLLGLTQLATVGSLLLANLGGILLTLFENSQPGSGFNLGNILAAVWLVLGALIAMRTRETRGRIAEAATVPASLESQT
jgi:MFS family permease